MNPAYTARRTSEMPWVDDLPAHWDVRPLLAVARERTEGNSGMREDNLLSLSYGRIVSKDITSNDGLLPESFETYQIVEPGDVVLRLTDLQNDKRSLRSGLVATRGIITSAYAAVVPFAIDPKYLSHLMRAYDLTKVFYSMGGGLRQSMKYSDMRRLPIIVPPLREQVAIAAFLDRETAKIDALLEEQRRLIELLKEKRQAVITHAVTRGLDPKVKMKPSGVEWIGDLPEHWAVAPLKHCCDLIKDGTHLPPPRVAAGIPLLSVRNLQDGDFGFLADDSMISEADYEALARSFLPQAGDVMLAIVGATLGKSALVKSGMGRFHIQRSVAAFRTGPTLAPTWLNAVFGSRGFQASLWRQIGFSAQPGIYLGSLEAFRIPLPSMEEQLRILRAVEPKVAKIDGLVAGATSAMELLTERRAALISAAVTGKIDVREQLSGTAVNVSGLVAAEIVGRLAHMPTFGRVKFQKIVYLAEAEAGISEFQGDYLRAAAGPLDRELIDRLEAYLVRAGHLMVEQLEGIGSPVRYRLRAARTTHGDDLAAALGERYATLHHIIDAVADLDTKGTEAVATLYAVWNDFLIDGAQPGDDAIASAVLDDWHPEKRKKFRMDELLTWLGWMRRHGLVPRGNGPRTTTGRLFA